MNKKFTELTVGMMLNWTLVSIL